MKKNRRRRLINPLMIKSSRGFTLLKILIAMAVFYSSHTPAFIVPTLRRGNSVRNAPALRDAGASATAFPRRSVTAIKLRKKLPLLLERVGVRRIKIRKIALFNPLILTFSRREKELSILNLMAVRRSVGTMQRAKRLSIKTWAEA